MQQTERSDKGLNTEFGVDRGGDRGGAPVPGESPHNRSSDTFRMPEDARPPDQKQGQEVPHSPGDAAQRAHGQEGEADVSKPPSDSGAAIEPEADASGQAEGKTHDL